MANILILDDDKDILNLLGTILRQSGHQVHCLEDGRQAVAIHKESPIDLIITDILMPEFDGIEVIRQFRQLSPELKIIAISGGGYTDPQQFLSMAQRLGADATFNKPFDWNMLVAKADALLGASK